MPPTQKPRFDLANPDVLGDPYPMFRQMREEEPVHWSDAIHAWVVTRYRDVLEAFRDTRLSNNRTEFLIHSQLRDSDPALAGDYARVLNEMMLMKDGREHHRLRVLGNYGFTPSMLDRARPMIQRVVDELLDELQPRGRFDVAADLAQPLPAIVIAELFGIPARDRGLFQGWSDDVARFFGGTLGDREQDARAANAATLGLENYFSALLEERRRKPGDDLMSLLLEGQAEGKLSAAEVCAQCQLFLAAGHVTTIDQLSNAIYTLLSHPEQWRKLRDDPGLVRSAVEECLRYDGAVPLLHRVAMTDLEMGGKTIRKGQVVYLALAAANRDPEVFAEPDTFDVARSNNRHLAFGAGPHICIGAGLARREMEMGLLALLQRMPTLHLVEGETPRRRCESLLFRGFHSLPVAIA
jgi:cytochrome P450 PksS